MLVEWETVPDVFGCWIGQIKAQDHRGVGFYKVIAVPRPNYCDRGSWLVHIESHGIEPLDEQEGFPRYYFKTLTMKEEMELWAMKRESVREFMKARSEPDQRKAAGQ